MSDLRDGSLMDKINKRRSVKRVFEEHDESRHKGKDSGIEHQIETTLANFERKQHDPSKFGRQELKAYMLKYF